MEQKDNEAALEREARAARELLNTLRAVEPDADDELTLDMFEGETNLLETIAGVLDQIDEDDMMLDAIKNRMDDLEQRSARLSKRIDLRRAAILQAMQIAELTKLPLPTATLSVKKSPDGVVIDDETAIPTEYWRRSDPRLDKAALKKALKDGAVPGARMEARAPTLAIRRS